MSVSENLPVPKGRSQSPITGTGIQAGFDMVHAAQNFQLGKFAHAALSLTLIFSLTFAPAIPAFAQGKLVGDATRQVKPPVDSPNGVLTSGLRGGPQDGGGCNVPTDASHSPLFDSKPFTQHMLRFEEFGSAPLDSNAENTGYKAGSTAGCSQDYDSEQAGYCSPLPQPTWAGASKGGKYYAYGQVSNKALDTTMGQPLYPYPTVYTNKDHPNPWEAAIVAEHTGPMQPLVAGDKYNTIADGRPPGPQFGHQRWDEFFPKVYTQTAQAGVRPNGGFRDRMQKHDYDAGEFGPGGLYHNSVHSIAASACSESSSQTSCDSVANPLVRDGLDKMCTWNSGNNTCSETFAGTTAGIRGKFHPLFPEQDHQALRTFDGTFPPKLMMTRYSQSVLFRHHNALPIKFEANRGFGNHFITTHHHNGHNPAESDGFAEAFFLPGQFYDYAWPMILAGHDPVDENHPHFPATNPRALEMRASTPCDEDSGEVLTVSLPSPTKNGAGQVCERADKLKENATRVAGGASYGEATYEDSAACGWRSVKQMCDANGRVQVPGDWKETMSTHWFHDHMLDFTAQNVYKGNAAMMNIYSGIDSGREGWLCHQDDPENNVNLCLPSGSALKWGNRDYDINLELAGKAWGQDTRVYEGTDSSLTIGAPAGKTRADATSPVEGQLWFNHFNTDGFLGDRMTVNWLSDPFLNVRARRYRFRVLNAHVSRFLRVALVVQRGDTSGEFPGKIQGVSYDRVPFYMVGNDGNIMEHSLAMDGSRDLDADGDLQEHHGILPTLSIAERWDLVVDFSENNGAGLKPGDKLYMVNLLEHKNGKRPQQSISLADALSGAYSGDGIDTACDTVVDKFLEFRIQSCTDKAGNPANSCQVGDGAIASQQDQSMDPGLYVEGNANGPGGSALTMIPMPTITPQELEQAHHRTFIFGRGAATDFKPKTITEAQGTNSAAPSHVPFGTDDFVYEVNGEGINFDEHHKVPVLADLPWGIKVDEGDMLNGDMNRLSAAPKLGDLEIWHIQNGGGGWSHNVHIHFEEGRILTRDGQTPPDWERFGRKDVYRVGRMDDSGSEITLAMRFRDFGGAYMEHCHNTQHEDHSMLLRWDIENPGQLSPFLTPEPQWNGCTYTESYALPTARTQENGRDRPGELVGDFKAKEDFLDDNNAAGLLCAAGAIEACNSGTSTPVGNGGTQVAIPVIEPSVTPDNNVTPVAPPEDTNTTPPVAAEKPKENKEAKKAAKAAKKAAKEAKKAAKKAKKRRGGKGKN
jgi:FtsP/CotA-like multicopper oxidase with cupredoxin domain